MMLTTGVDFQAHEITAENGALLEFMIQGQTTYVPLAAEDCVVVSEVLRAFAEGLPGKHLEYYGEGEADDN